MKRAKRFYAKTTYQDLGNNDDLTPGRNKEYHKSTENQSLAARYPGHSPLAGRPKPFDSRSTSAYAHKTGANDSKKYARAYIAFGSNLGDRIDIIERSCRELCSEGIQIVRTSGLYETKAMYIENQPSFINGVCEVLLVDSSPLQLLRQLQVIEKRLGRKKTIDKGPRNIDLDILLFENYIVEHEDLHIPHKAMLEREFVLRPLCDINPLGQYPREVTSETFEQRLATLPRPASPLSPLTPLTPQLTPIASRSPHRRTHVMAILNLTPDSFSDGGEHKSTPEYLYAKVKSFADCGASIVDIGGQSTRPHAPEVSAEEELNRVLPAIKYIRSIAEFDGLAISIDTYRASVAAAAIEAGANIINDVSAGVMDSAMLPTAARLGCTIILMHMRGTPATMNDMTFYEPNGLIPTIATELLERVRAAETAGIFRWRIMVDPGIGFAKNQEQNLGILRHLEDLRNWEGLRGLPWLVGPSRKKFIQTIIGDTTNRSKDFGTSAAITAAIQNGADIVRVHDVEGMSKVAKVADAIFRGEVSQRDHS